MVVKCFVAAPVMPSETGVISAGDNAGTSLGDNFPVPEACFSIAFGALEEDEMAVAASEGALLSSDDKGSLNVPFL